MNTGAGVGPVGREEAQEARGEGARIQELGVRKGRRSDRCGSADVAAAAAADSVNRSVGEAVVFSPVIGPAFTDRRQSAHYQDIGDAMVSGHG